MAGIDWEARAAKFVQRVAHQLCSDPNAVTSLSLPLPHLESLLRESIKALPENSLRSALQKDFTRFLNLLLDEVRASRPDLASPSVAAANDEATSKIDAPTGSALTDAYYLRATEAVIAAAGRAIPSAETQNWRFATERLLLARANPPLPLLWAYLALSRASVLNSVEISEEVEKLPTLLNAVECLWQCLKTATCVLIDQTTAVAAIAPVVALIYDLILKLSAQIDAATGEGKTSRFKDCRRLLKRLRSVVADVLTFTAACRRRKYSYCQNLLLSPNSSMLNRGLGKRLDRFVEVFSYPMPRIQSGDEPKKLHSLPLIPEAQQKRWRKRGQLDHLADAVSIEIFFLQLLVLMLESKIGSQNKNKNSDLEDHKKLKPVAIHAAANILSLSSYEMLLDMLMKPQFSIPKFLNVEEETKLKEAIYEVTLSMDPSQFGWLKADTILEDSEKAGLLFIKRVAICRQAMNFFRSHNQWAKAQEMLTTLSPPFAPLHLVCWLASVDLHKLPTNLKDPHAVTDWLLKTADEGTFKEVLHLYTNIIHSKDTKSSKGKRESLSEEKARPSSIHEMRDDLDNELYYIDTHGEDILAKENEEAELAAVNEALFGAAKKMRTSRKKSKKKDPILFHRHQQSVGSKRQHDDTTDESSDEST